jgi:hypothetical protein
MNKNDLFLDSGLIYGCIDIKDGFVDASSEFFKQYPFEENNYYTVMRLMKREMDTIRKRKTSEGDIKTKKVLRQIEQKWNSILFRVPPMMINIDYINPDDPICIQLHRKLLQVLNARKKKNDSKDRDADYLTNAFLWDSRNTNLNNQHFVTIDGKDIAGNKEELINEAANCIGIAPRLKFCLIRKG